ncbi:MAG: hypothetical protein UX09_C0026G0004 [Candidatus Uhrbacteria bacterium GW2011_GWE2_45_35]|uniref:DUF3179 domain-containing protein n=2 Tax=Candidatus Uhriibacteriota TaxID=1752732 RepID=A0A0G1JJ66_9BACT|nr:MAG: hypothetical protein UW63_C0012G0005 [Candidatus Uhrbacteria bacterium GW2011_GWF2_44_350]KKU07653.1 MAG: hypothetical protein UX09_C0026G0004 [Candidatus Uhrbacteria bacterium GW2011_GWE2_45_35]HBR80064.1 hypothetical protein [Candidatus Uhrbacteria bacterium]HCU31236.1 hypothetical protein [Candidatus Uhrbacteria bacterium]
MSRRQLSKFHWVFIFCVLILVAVFLRFYFVYRLPQNLAALSLEELIIDSGIDNESMPAIEKPIFESVPSADAYLQNEGQGIVLVKKNEARFYPFQILVWHNFVNDTWNNQSILLAYDPFCGSAAVFDRQLSNGESPIFINSGKIYNNNILFTVQGETSLWSSFSGKILSAAETEETLEKIPAFIMTWQNFRYAFPSGKVLSRETGFSRDYSQNPYGTYASSPEVWYPLTKYDSSLPAKTFVYGFDQAVFPKDNIESSGQIVVTNENKKIAFVWDEDLETVRGFELESDESFGQEIALSPSYWFCSVAQVSEPGFSGF